MYLIAKQQIEPGNRIEQRSDLSLWFILVLLASSLFVWSTPGQALEDVCAAVKIEIVQELSLERQAFEATMRINNGLDTLPLEDIRIDVTFADENGLSVLATSDPNNTSASFFIRVNTMQGIADISGFGVVTPSSTADINWLIIPAPGTGGELPSGKLYYVGATLTYTIDGEETVTEVSPDYIFVKPTPLLALDYFLPQDVFADDAFTPAVEAPVPFTLGVRVQNHGFGTANNVTIESAQPRIVENELGLLIDFRILGSYVGDAPDTPSLLIDFGDIPGNEAVMGRWKMITTLSGQFTEFTAEFTHSDELGGQLTSLLDTVMTHTLVRDVLVDLPGRDTVRDFLAQDGLLRVYESSGVDTEVADRSSSTVLSPASQSGSRITYQLNTGAEAGFFYARAADPTMGNKAIVTAFRSDGKPIREENVWFSKTRNGQSWNYWLNIFDIASTGQYTLVVDDPIEAPQPPTLQFIPDRTTYEGNQISFIVEASDPNGTIPVLTATNLPAGANFVGQGNGTGIFDWTPTIGQAGVYAISYTASDGVLSRSQMARITVNPVTDTDGDGIPDDWEQEYFGTLDHDMSLDTDGDGLTDAEEFDLGTDPLGLDGATIPLIDAPWFGAAVTTTQPTLTVLNATHKNPGATLYYEFEAFSDAGFRNMLVSSGMVSEGLNRTSWVVSTPLPDNQPVYWRARAYDGLLYTAWAYGNFLVDTVNDAPSVPLLSYPADASQVGIAVTLEVLNATDPDGDDLFYQFDLFSDPALTTLVESSGSVPADLSGHTSYPVATVLGDGNYYWRVTAGDSQGASTDSQTGFFMVDSINAAPTAPALSAPQAGARVMLSDVTLSVTNATDADTDPLQYRFEIDTLPTFNSPDLVTSLPVNEGSGTTSWVAAGLADNQVYYWRSQASDGTATGPWVYGQFRVDTANDPPPIAILANPSDGAWDNQSMPELSVMAVPDPDGDVLTYQFEIYSDAALTTQVASGSSTTPDWEVPTGLTDHSWFYWRARADDTTTPGAWSATGSLYINTSEIVSIADVNQDGLVNSVDMGRMMSEWAATGLGDLNQDGIVDEHDFRLLLEQYNY